MANATSRPHVERESALSPFPSVFRLAAGLTFISIGCVGLHFGSTIITPLSFSSATWLFTSHAEWHRRLAARDYALLFIVIGAFAALIVAENGRQAQHLSGSSSIPLSFFHFGC